MESGRRRVIVVGAGAAGTMAAIFSAGGGVETLLLERTPDGGRKILISGGGRCNILPARPDEGRFVTDSSVHTLRKMLRSWPLAEQISFFERDAGLPLAEETETGKLFPASSRARDVRDRLFALARRRGVQLLTNTLVTGLIPQGARWRVERAGAPPIEADAVIVATGGLSIPKSGSDGSGIGILRALGHVVHETYPALTPLTAAASVFSDLAGVSLAVSLTARDGARTATAAGGFLFTHQGYSGPAVLDVSHVAVRSLGDPSPARLSVRWSGRKESDWAAALRPEGSKTVAGALRGAMPDRLASALARAAGVNPARPLSRLPREERVRLVEQLTRGALPWDGHEGYAKAEVTGGGVSLAEIDPRTMESRRCSGLF
ncbi:MAG: aminoacetone oxidase family FAD-binding enzyme, partial [Acidobacteria bacterium]|nr:aminoacetone oxidase family FAD-binding enzyme [Acidobacteriota bacterium]